MLLSDVDPAAPAPDRFCRLAQAVAFHRAHGAGVDLLTLGDPVLAPARDWPPEGIDRLGHLPAGPARAVPGGGPGRVEAAMRAMGGARGHDLVHLDGVTLAGAAPGALPLILDAGEGVGLRAGALPPVDLLMAAAEPVRARLGGAAARSVRLPLAPGGPTALSRAPMVGWPGPLDAALAGAWGALLDRLAALGARLPDGLLLAGGGGVAVPPLMARARALPEAVPRIAAQRATGLGVLPAVPEGPFLHDLTALIAQGRPVLVPPAVAAIFEDRWHLPTPATREELAQTILGWAEGGAVRETLAAAAAATRHAFAADHRAMAAHAAELVAEVVGAPAP